MTGFVNPQRSFNYVLPASGRNRVVNGDMRIDQPQAGSARTVNAASFFNGLDKWKGFGVGAAGVYNFQRQTATPPAGFSHYLRATVTTADAGPAAGSVYILQHVIEGTYCPDFQMGIAANTQGLTLSFWFRSSLFGVFSGAIQNAAANRSYVFNFTYPTQNVWQRFTTTIPSDTAGAWNTDTNAGILLTLDFGSGANFTNAIAGWQAANITRRSGAVGLLATNGATLDLTGVQIEPGNIATSFDQRPFVEMLLLCQREFCKSFNLAQAPAQNVGNSTGELRGWAQFAGAIINRLTEQFPVVMRTVPSMSFFSPGSASSQCRDESLPGDCSATAISNTTERRVEVIATGAAGTAVGNLLGVHWTADARL